MRSLRTVAATVVYVILASGFVGTTFALTGEIQNVLDAVNEEVSPGPEKQVEARLDLGHPIEGELAAGGKQTFSVILSAGQYAHFAVEPQDIDVSVAIIEPKAHQMLRLLSAYGVQGPIDVYILAASPGSYKLEVAGTDNNAHPGRYKVNIPEIRRATARDAIRLEAQEILSHAQQLREKGTAESRRMAAEKYSQAVSLWRSTGDRLAEAQTLEQLGIVHNELGENRKAISSLKSSLELFKSVRDRRGEAMALSDLGSVHNDIGDNKEALTYLNEALPIRREISDRRGEAETLENIGTVYENVSEADKALESYGVALALRRNVGDRRGEAQSLDDIGVVYYDIDEEPKALDYYTQALALQVILHDRWGEALTYNNMGSAYNSSGEKKKAIEYFAKALPLKRANGNRRGEATTLGNMCWLEFTLGEWQSALERCNTALALNRAVGDRQGETQTLTSLGALYVTLGEKERALRQFEMALAQARATGSRLWQGIVLNNMGFVFSELGDHKKALKHYDLALPFRRTAGDREGEAATLSSIGSSHDALGEKEMALKYFNEALQVARSRGIRRWEAGALGNMGWFYAAHEEREKALDAFDQALLLYRGLGDQRGEASVLYGTARVQRDLGDLRGALAQIEAALGIVETLRTKVTNLQLRASYFSSVREYYEFYIDLLMLLDKAEPANGYVAKAVEVSERSRARSLLDTLREAHAEIRQGVDVVLLEREHSLQQILDGKTERQMRLLAGKHNDGQVAAAKSEIGELLVEFQGVEAQIRARSPGYAALTQPQPLGLAEIQKRLLDVDTVLLEYWLGGERSYLWLVTTDSLKSFELPKRAEIEIAARRVYELLTERNRFEKSENQQQRKVRRPHSQSEYLEASLILSQIVLGPVAQLIRGKRLAIVSDGALQYVPFGALPFPSSTEPPGGRSPLIVDQEVISLPSASVMGLLRQEVERRKSMPKLVAVLADPVFSRDDSRVRISRPNLTAPGNATQVEEAAGSKLGQSLSRSRLTRSVREAGIRGKGAYLPRLVFSRQEARSILAVTPAGLGLLALDFAASRATATNPELAQYRIIHFATHGLLDSEHPELSGLVLSLVDEQGKTENGFLDLQDIYNLNLSAELVVLSACETGLGKEVKGEGLVGLTRGFMYAGAPRVVATLWNVDDAASAELMGFFYKGMLQQGLRPSAALREAQVQMWKHEQWADPYYWAGFTIQGDWN